MFSILRNVVLGLLALGLLVGIFFGVIAGILVVRNLNNPQPVIVQQSPAINPVNPVVANPVSAPASDCTNRAKEIGAPEEVVSAICDAVPGGNGVSMRLPVGTKVTIGIITFDAEDRVWFLQGFTTPLMANYAFEYAGAETALFDAPFVVGSELGWGKDGTRVPFKICWDVTSDGCIPPTELFPTK